MQAWRINISNKTESELLRDLKGMGNEKYYFILNISFESTFKIIY